MTVLFFQVSFFQLGALEKSWERCLASIMLFITMILMAAVPIIIIVAIQNFQLLIDFVRRGNDIAWGSRSSTLLHSFTHELGYQHQDHKILVIFHLLGLFCHHYQISPFLPLTVDNSRACCPKACSQPLWPTHILPPASVVQLKMEPRHNWCLVWFRTSHKTDLPCTLSEVDQFIAFTLIACQNLWNETWWNLWIQMAHK